MSVGPTNLPIFAVDFEGSPTSGIVEYGLVEIQNGEITGVKARLCRARAAINAYEFRCHKIRYEDTLSEQPFAADFPDFLQRRARGPFAAHNSVFENSMLRAEGVQTAHLSPLLGNRSLRGGWGPWVDTYSLYKRCFPDLKHFTLKSLIKAFELQETLEDLARRHCPKNRCAYHCALFDALACAILLIQLMKNEALQPLTLQWLLIHSANGMKDFKALNQQRWAV
jgi:DNA polymerase-3 subunit epsilon